MGKLGNFRAKVSSLIEGKLQKGRMATKRIRRREVAPEVTQEIFGKLGEILGNPNKAGFWFDVRPGREIAVYGDEKQVIKKVKDFLSEDLKELLDRYDLSLILFTEPTTKMGDVNFIRASIQPRRGETVLYSPRKRK